MKKILASMLAFSVLAFTAAAQDKYIRGFQPPSSEFIKANSTVKTAEECTRMSPLKIGETVAFQSPRLSNVPCELTLLYVVRGDSANEYVQGLSQNNKVLSGEHEYLSAFLYLRTENDGPDQKIYAYSCDIFSCVDSSGRVYPSVLIYGENRDLFEGYSGAEGLWIYSTVIRKDDTPSLALPLVSQRDSSAIWISLTEGSVHQESPNP